MSNIKHEKVKIAIAKQYKGNKSLQKKRAIFSQMKIVLARETKWLQNVQYEFDLNRIEAFWYYWKSYIRYKRVKNLRKFKIYSKFIERLLEIINEKDLKRQELIKSIQMRRLFILVDAFKSNVVIEKRKKYLEGREHLFRTQRLTSETFNALKGHYQQMKMYKND